jgi:hypothetical protein
VIDIATSCLYLLQPQYPTITCLLPVSPPSKAFHWPPWLTSTRVARIWYSNPDSIWNRLYLIQQFSHPPCSVVNSCFHCILPFFRVLVLFEMGMLNSLNPVSKFSHITQSSFPEFRHRRSLLYVP